MLCVLFADNTASVHIDVAQNQHLSISDGVQNGLDLFDDFTLETWVKFDAIQNNDDDIFIAKRSPFGNRSYFFYKHGNGERASRTAIVAGWRCSIWWKGQREWNPTTNTWYHLAVSKSGTTVKFYVNGIQQGPDQTGTKAQVHDGAADFRIGADQDDAADDFDGLIDDVRVWNIARSAADIAENMDNELAGDESGSLGTGGSMTGSSPTRQRTVTTSRT